MNAKGFTLFELIVVLALISLVAALTAPMMFADGSRVETRSAAFEVAAALRRARAEAISENLEKTLLVDVNERQFRIDGFPIETLPDGVQVGLFTAQSEQLSESVGAIRFFPDGSATGGEVKLVGKRVGYQVQIDWLTGRVSLIETPITE